MRQTLQSMSKQQITTCYFPSVRFMSTEVITMAAVASNAECFHFTSQRSVTFWPSAAGATSKKVQSKIKNCNYSRQYGKDRVCVCEPSVRKEFVVVEALQTWTVLSMDTFIFQPNQTALVREQHLSLRLHECLHGTVITDHRLMLQRSDSSDHTVPRGHAEFAMVTDSAVCAVSHRSPACQ